MSRRLLTSAVVLGGLLAWGQAPAGALFSPFTLAAGNPERELQADYAYAPAVSADGGYVAFTGSVGSEPGVYRKDLATGRLEPVLAGPPGTLAGAPSISADGRYVSFTTNEDPATGRPFADGCTNVYVADMGPPERPAGGPAYPVYELASAPSGSTQPLTYAAPATAGAPCGAASADRVALSGDGRTVAFTVLSESNLDGPKTPPDQVAVRELPAAGEPGGPGVTTLVSTTLASQGEGASAPVPGGAALAGGTSSKLNLTDGQQVDLAEAASTAAISSDGSTVGWMGVDVAAQAPVARPLKTEGFTDGYAEPLWRRIGEGPAAPTRRVLAGDDASAPGCPPECPGGLDLDWDEQDLTGYAGAAPAWGSFTSDASGGNFAEDNGFEDSLDAVTPQLSADGSEVALLSTQPGYGNDPNFGTLSGTKPPPANAFLVRMAPGATRAQSIVRLTDWASLNFNSQPLAGAVQSIAISADGSRVLFTTRRVEFPLAPPALITPQLSQAAATQLYEANVPAGTLALVSEGYNGEPANGGVFAAAPSGDGQTLAVASAAGNLAFGTVNGGSDVYVTDELRSPAVAGAQSVTPLPAESTGDPGWSIAATATSTADGALQIDVSVPGAGSVGASASAAVPSSHASSRRGAHSRSHGRARSAKARGRTGRGRRVVAGAVVTRVVARRTARSSDPGLVTLRLTPAAQYNSLIYGAGGLFATVRVTFTAPGHPRQTVTLQGSFRWDRFLYGLPTPKHGKKGKRSKHGRGRR